MCLSSVYPRCEQSCLGNRGEGWLWRGWRGGEQHTSPRRTTCPPSEDVLRWKYKCEGLEHAQPRSPSVSHQLHLFSVGNPVFYSPLLQEENRHLGAGVLGQYPWIPEKDNISLSSWFHSLSTCLGCVLPSVLLHFHLYTCTVICKNSFLQKLLLPIWLTLSAWLRWDFIVSYLCLIAFSHSFYISKITSFQKKFNPS